MNYAQEGKNTKWFLNYITLNIDFTRITGTGWSEKSCYFSKQCGLLISQIWTKKITMKLNITFKLYLLIIIGIFHAYAVIRSGIYKKLDTTKPEYSNKVSFVQCNLHPLSGDEEQCSIGCINEGLCIGFDFKSPNCFLCYFDVNSQTYGVRGEFYTQLLTPTVGE